MSFRLVVQPRRPVHVHPIDVVREGAEIERPRLREASWIVVLYRDERRAFDSRSVSLEPKTERGARWLGQLVRAAIEAEAFAPSSATLRSPIDWIDGAQGDCHCAHGPLAARVERRTGVSDAGFRVAVRRHDPPADLVDEQALAADLLVRTRDAGRFLAEVVLDLARVGRPIPHPRDIAPSP